MTITETTHAQLDRITDEQKKEMRAKIEQQAGTPYHRTILAIFRDGDRAIAGFNVDAADAEAEVRSLRAELDDSERKAVALSKERYRAEDKLERVFSWLQSYAKELSARGSLDNGSPEKSVEGARAAIVVREAAKQLQSALDLPETPVERGIRIHEAIEKSLLKSMGNLTMEEASHAIQQHAPWNGKATCDVPEGESEAAVVVIGAIEQALAKYYKQAAENWGAVAKLRRKDHTHLPVLDGEDGKLHQNERSTPSPEDGKS
jgi:hypothetical protein